jgi:hypothetical protein
MSTQRILSLCLGLSALVLFGCSDSIVDPESSMPREEIGSRSQTLDRQGFGDLTRCFFPLHEGDRWIYRISRLSDQDQGGGVEIEEVQVTGGYPMGDYQVFQLDNYLFPVSGGGIEFCNAEPGHAMEVVGEDLGLWYPWCQFGPEELPIELPGSGDDCVHGSTGRYVGLDTVTVPAGTFHRAATILYDSSPCADNGFAREVFAPEIGLIERTTTTFLGQVTWKLVYANVGGQEWGTPPQM